MRRTVADAMVLGLSQDEVCDLIGGTVEEVLGFAGGHESESESERGRVVGIIFVRVTPPIDDTAKAPQNSAKH